ncbi:MAG: arsenate reductase family protein [Calditrichaeota bacterium]|nr:arsenate reductase family protein [Calditrichota bacterium]
MIRIYGVPSCDKIKKTLKLLDNNKIAYEFANVRKTPVEKGKLKIITDALGIDLVLNRQGMLYRKLGLKDKNLTSDQLFEQLFNEQGMIKRPLIEYNGKFHVGYDEEKILQFIK